MHGPGAKFAGVGGRKGGIYVTALTFVNCSTYKYVGKMWLKGAVWVSALTTLNTTAAKSTLERMRNTDEGLNGAAVLKGPAIKNAFLKVYNGLVAVGLPEVSVGKLILQKGILHAKNLRDSQTTLDEMYPVEKYRTYSLSLVGKGNDSYLTTHFYYNTHRRQHQPLPTSYRSADALVNLNVATY